MSDKSVLQEWVVEALQKLGGSGSVVGVCKVIWQVHEHDLRASGDLFYTWQYDGPLGSQGLAGPGRSSTHGGPRGGAMVARVTGI